MHRYFYIILIFIISGEGGSLAQALRYSVNPVSFSSKLYDEFSPVLYNGGIAFCSNQSDNSLVSYNDSQSRLYKIFFVSKRGSTGWTNPKLLAKEITTAYNDGPVTFNEKGTIMYYSRNNSVRNVMKNVSDTSNKLGIYYAELKDGLWNNIRPFPYNNLKYSLGTPSLTPDGNRIYFSSDMPGGRGGMDLYYCDRKNDEWDKPVNLGPIINTAKNESFPFVSGYGKLFFASDGLKGFGGKDLFYTRQINNEWIEPVHLDSAINSPYDDFGIVTDSSSLNGYFSTNRRNTDDIFNFSTVSVDFLSCDSMKENRYCFTFYDEQHKLIDTIPLTYHWDFGDGRIVNGKEVKHCFPGSGKYNVRLSITDELTGTLLSEQVEYDVDLKNIEQAIIISPDNGKVGKPISFEGVTTDLTGKSITDYLWDFGDGFIPGGPLMNTSFKKKGGYVVRLGLLTGKDSLGVVQKMCYMKKIIIN